MAEDGRDQAGEMAREGMSTISCIALKEYPGWACMIFMGRPINGKMVFGKALPSSTSCAQLF